MTDIQALRQAVKHYADTLNDRFSVKDLAIVENEDELLLQLGQEESFEDVFNSWHRFSRNNAGGLSNDAAIPAELDAWLYDAENNRIVCTENTSSYVGFVSNGAYDHYVLETIMRSDDNDDDHIGLCAAYTTLPNGEIHSLDFTRHGHTNAPAFIHKNYGMTNHRSVIEQIRSGLTWMDGTVADSSLANGALPGWRTIPNGVLMKITREGDILTFETSQFDDNENYFEPAKRVIDLSSDPSLEVFRGPQPYGYTCYSQRNSTWEVLRRPGSRVPVLDAANGVLYTWDGDDWSQTPWDSASADLGAPGLYLNVHTEKLFYVDVSKDILIKLGQTQ